MQFATSTNIIEFRVHLHHATITKVLSDIAMCASCVGHARGLLPHIQQA
jgi:hypothetical protein